MKRLITTAILINSIKGITHWFNIMTATKPVLSIAKTGPNLEYIVQGRKRDWVTYSINWDSGTFNNLREFQRYSNQLNLGGGLNADRSYNVILTDKRVVRFNMKPGGTGGQETMQLYPIATGTSYASAATAINTVYFFVTRSLQSNDGFYRLHVDRITDIERYPFTSPSNAYGVISGTGWLLISGWNIGHRTLIDYTNGYVGGTNSSVATHTKTGHKQEKGFMSPEDGRNFYVVLAEQTGFMYTFTSVEGQEHLSYDFDADLGDKPNRVAWVYDTDFCFITSKTRVILLVDFMDKNKDKNNAMTLLGLQDGAISTKPVLWSDKRVVIFSNVQSAKSEVYRISTSKQPCSDLCSTCHDLYRNRCLTCKPHSSPHPSANGCICDSNYYEAPVSFTRKQCVQCSLMCLECSGPEATHCTSCKDQNMEVKGDGSCGCKDGFYPSGTTCQPCDSSCLTCSAGGQNSCLSCSGSRLFGQSNNCISCPEEESSECPQPTQIEAPLEIEELTKNLTITFTPSLGSQLGFSASPSWLTAEVLLKDHLKVAYKNNTESMETELTILIKTLNHSDPMKTTLFLSYSEELQYAQTEYIKIAVKHPVLFKSPISDPPNQKMVYFKSQWSKKINITKRSNEINQKIQKSLEEAERYGKVASITLFASCAAWISVAACFGRGTTSIFYLIRLFNIIDIISSLGHINVNFGSNIEVVLRFLENIKIPEIEFLVRLSPIEGSEDSNAYQIVARGSRAKMTTENSQLLIISGQNFVFSISIVASWVIKSILEQCLSPQSLLLKIASLIHVTLIGLMFFEYQSICGAEIAFFGYSRIRKTEAKFLFSLVLSMSIMTLILAEILSTVNIFNQKGREAKTFQKNSKIEKIDTQNNKRNKNNDKVDDSVRETPSEGLLLEKYTEVLDLEKVQKIKYERIVLVGDIRFFAFQLVIVALQLLNRTQSVLVLLINLVYLIYFIRALLTSTVFKSKMFTINQIVQEVCIMVFITTITLFSFTEKSGFADSLLYRLIEYVTIGSIIGVCGAEFLCVVAEAGSQLGVIVSKIYKICMKSDNRKNDKVGEERTIEKTDPFDNFREIQSENPLRKASSKRLRFSKKESIENERLIFSTQRPYIMRGENHMEMKAQDKTPETLSVFGRRGAGRQGTINISIKKPFKRGRIRNFSQVLKKKANDAKSKKNIVSPKKN